MTQKKITHQRQRPLMRPLTAMVPVEHHAALVSLARRSGLSVADLLRRSISISLADTERVVEAYAPTTGSRP